MFQLTPCDVINILRLLKLGIFTDGWPILAPYKDMKIML